MQRIELRSDIYGFQDTKDLNPEFKWMDLDSETWAESRKFGGLIHTEHRHKFGSEGIYVVQIFEKQDNGPGARIYAEPNRVEREWTKAELQTIIEREVAQWQAMADGEDVEMTSVV